MILTGIREGDFIIKKDGKDVPLASNPKSRNYNKKWKEIVMKYASDIIEVLAAFVFEGSAEAEDEDVDVDGGSTVENAEKN
jgi:hypothetical protein